MFSQDEVVHGDFGSMAFRKEGARHEWVCFESSDYKFYGIVDDFGEIVAVSEYINIRGY